MNQQLKNLLKKIKSLSDGQQNFWNISEEVGQFLAIMVKSLRAQTVLEIGTSNGYSGIWLADALRETGGKLYTIESHKERFAMAAANFQAAELTPYIVQIKGHAPEVIIEPTEYQPTGNYANIPNQLTNAVKAGTKFDLCFLDATKKEHINYLKTVLPLCTPGALIITDNVDSHREVMQEYINHAQECHQLENVLVPMGTGLLISRVVK